MGEPDWTTPMPAGAGRAAIRADRKIRRVAVFLCGKKLLALLASVAALLASVAVFPTEVQDGTSV
jgi:hypothetical protein